MSYPLAVNRIRNEKLMFPDRGGKFGPHVRGAKGHTGWDLSAHPGTSVFAVGPGTITVVATTPKSAKYGKIVQLKFLRGSKHYWALYAHLSQTWVTVGQQVAEGQVIGSTGTSGNAEGEPPHLHFEIATDGSLRKRRHNYIDPSIILGSFLKDQPGGEGVVRESSYELDIEDIDRYINRAHTA